MADATKEELWHEVYHKAMATLNPFDSNNVRFGFEAGYTAALASQAERVSELESAAKFYMRGHECSDKNCPGNQRLLEALDGQNDKEAGKG